MMNLYFCQSNDIINDINYYISDIKNNFKSHNIVKRISFIY